MPFAGGCAIELWWNRGDGDRSVSVENTGAESLNRRGATDPAADTRAMPTELEFARFLVAEMGRLVKEQQSPFQLLNMGSGHELSTGVAAVGYSTIKLLLRSSSQR